MGPPGDAATTIFVHVPKTAGVSLTRIIEREYGRDAVWRVYGYERAADPRNFLDLTADKRAAIRAVVGHMEFGFHRLLTGPSRYVTILRDPIDRIVSHYHYLVHVAPERPRDALKGIDSLEAYVTRSPQASVFNNGQVRQLGGDLHVPGRPATRHMLEQALRNLEQFAVVGLQERFDESVLLMRQALGWGWPVLARHNTTPNRPGLDAVDTHTRELITEHNALDLELYKFGRACFERQLAAYGPSLDEDLATLRRVRTSTAPHDGPSLSVVVMGYRNEATIVAAVRSVLDQAAEDPIEVIAVVSGDDRSAELLRECGPRVHVVASPTRLLPGGARNAGIAQCHGEVVAFLAGDCVATPMWAAGRIAAHRAGHDVVAGAVDVAKGAGTLARAELLLLYSARLAGHPGGPASHPQAHGLSFSRWVLDQMEPFRDDVRIGEDTLMLEQLEWLGIPVWFEPSIVIEHVRPTSFVAFLRDQHTRGRRASQWDAMRGGFPHRWFDSIPGLGVLARAVKRVVARAKWTVPNAWRGSHGHRVRFVAAMPAVLMGLIARQWGWTASQLTRSSSGSRSW